jgi:3D (Asp-Asp-Asp) domain-containing protein
MRLRWFALVIVLLYLAFACSLLTALDGPERPQSLRPVSVGAEVAAGPPEPRPTPAWRGSRSRAPAAPSPPAKRPAVVRRSAGSRLSVTCYVWTGNRTASGVWPRVGMAAGNRWPFGTRLLVEGVGVVMVTDRIGHSSQLDLFMSSRSACLRFGRKQLRVQVLSRG